MTVDRIVFYGYDIGIIIITGTCLSAQYYVPRVRSKKLYYRD